MCGRGFSFARAAQFERDAGELRAGCGLGRVGADGVYDALRGPRPVEGEIFLTQRVRNAGRAALRVVRNVAAVRQIDGMRERLRAQVREAIVQLAVRFT